MSGNISDRLDKLETDLAQLRAMVEGFMGGTVTSRTVSSYSEFYPYGIQKFRLPAYFIGTGITLANILSRIDTAIANKSICAIGLHSLVDSPGNANEWPLADFKAIIDYLAANHVRCITASELYSMLLAYD